MIGYICKKYKYGFQDFIRFYPYNMGHYICCFNEKIESTQLLWRKLNRKFKTPKLIWDSTHFCKFKHYLQSTKNV